VSVRSFFADLSFSGLVELAWLRGVMSLITCESLRMTRACVLGAAPQTYLICAFHRNLVRRAISVYSTSSTWKFCDININIFIILRLIKLNIKFPPAHVLASTANPRSLQSFETEWLITLVSHKTDVASPGRYLRLYVGTRSRCEFKCELTDSRS
jgi:hypothetical protein